MIWNNNNASKAMHFPGPNVESQNPLLKAVATALYKQSTYKLMMVNIFTNIQHTN